MAVVGLGSYCSTEGLVSHRLAKTLVIANKISLQKDMHGIHKR